MSRTADTAGGSHAGAEKGGAAAAGGARSPFEERVLAELSALPGAVLESSFQRPQRLLARVRPESIVEVCRRLRTIGFDHLSCVTCVDYESELDIIYLLWSYKNRCLIELRSRIPGEGPKIASVTPVWTGAEFHEREAYDMFGVDFEGCPNLKMRVLLPDEWTLFPLRKSFKIESIHEKRKRLEAGKAKAAKAAAASQAAPLPTPPPPPAPPKEAAPK